MAHFMHKPCHETFAVHNLTLIFTCAWWEFQLFMFPKPILTLQVQILSALKSDLMTSLAALNPNIQLQLILFIVYHHTHIHVQAELLSYYVDHCFKPQFMRNPWVNPTGCHFSKLEKPVPSVISVAVTTANYIMLSAVLIQHEFEMCASFSATQQKKATQKDIQVH